MQKITFSFDFDGTLVDSDILQDYCKKLIEAGHNVKIITRRYGPNCGHKEDEHTYVYFVANELGIKLDNIHFTNRQWKYEKILEYGVHVHIDDDIMDSRHIKSFTKCFPIQFTEIYDWKKDLEDILSEKFITFEQL